MQAGVGGQLDEAQTMIRTSPSPTTQRQRSNSSAIPQPQQQQTEQPQQQSEYSTSETEPSPVLFQHDIPSFNKSSIDKLIEASTDPKTMDTKDAVNAPVMASSGGRNFDCNAEKPQICENGKLGWYLDKRYVILFSHI